MNKLLPLQLVSKLSGKYWRTKKRVEGSVAGRHTSSYYGHSLEFVQHREYTSGDEIKHIDWKLFGRKEKFFIKQFQAETNLRAYIVVDTSNSMGFSYSGGVSKIEYAKQLAAAISYLFIKQNDAVGFATIKNGEIAEFLAPKSGWVHLNAILNVIETITPSQRCMISSGINELAKRLKRRSLVILLSDLLENQPGIISSFKYLNSQHHDCTVIQVLDPAEVEIPFSGEVEFVDMETARMISSAWDISKEYNKKMAEFLSTYKVSFRKSGVEYHLALTNTSVDHTLSKILDYEFYLS